MKYSRPSVCASAPSSIFASTFAFFFPASGGWITAKFFASHAYSLPSPNTIDALPTVPTFCSQSFFPVANSSACTLLELSITNTVPFPSCVGDGNPASNLSTRHTSLIVFAFASIDAKSRHTTRPFTPLSGFSSELHAISLSPMISGVEFVPRFDSTYPNTFSPVRALNPYTPPSPAQKHTSRSPFTTVTIGVPYGASTGRPPVLLVHRKSPVSLSNAKHRCCPCALSPHPNSTPVINS